MRASTVLGLITMGLSHSVLAQDLASTLQNNPDVSTFQGLISQEPSVVSNLLPSSLSPNSSKGVTVLVPSNEAFSAFLAATNASKISDIPQAQLLSVLQYHIMYAKLTSADFSAAANGLVVPTLLKDEKYNNRTAGAELVAKYGADAAQGNVLYISWDPINPARLSVRAQQDASDNSSSSDSVSIRGGLGQGGTITAVDGAWDLGYYQIVDVVLSPPAPCSTTVRGQSNLKSLDTAITNAGLWDALDHSANVTCLAPSNTAFAAAGDPQTSLNASELSGALLFHTLPMALYSPFLESGKPLKVRSMAGVDVIVARVDGDVYFNDAKVISPNVLTNNGVLHVLDRVMSPNGTALGSAPTSSPTTTTGRSTSTATGGTRTSTTGVPGAGSSTGTASPNAANPAAVAVGGGNAVGGLLAFLGAAAVLF